MTVNCTPVGRLCPDDKNPAHDQTNDGENWPRGGENERENPFWRHSFATPRAWYLGICLGDAVRSASPVPRPPWSIFGGGAVPGVARPHRRHRTRAQLAQSALRRGWVRPSDGGGGTPCPCSCDQSGKVAVLGERHRRGRNYLINLINQGARMWEWKTEHRRVRCSGFHTHNLGAKGCSATWRPSSSLALCSHHFLHPTSAAQVLFFASPIPSQSRAPQPPKALCPALAATSISCR